VYGLKHQNVEVHFIFAPNNISNNVATSRIACLVFLPTIGRQVSPLYTPEDFLDSRVGTLPAINNPRTAALMVQRGHRDQLPSNYGVGRRVEPEAKFFNDFSRARACARKGASVRTPL
jgi:hypothetical protein